jgi:hypothetical protein
VGYHRIWWGAWLRDLEGAVEGAMLLECEGFPLRGFWFCRIITARQGLLLPGGLLWASALRVWWWVAAYEVAAVSGVGETAREAIWQAGGYMSDVQRT